MCGRCYDGLGYAEHGVELFTPTCTEKPEDTHGAIGMYHCPDCGAMILAGLPHPLVCARCRDKQHPDFDGVGV